MLIERFHGEGRLRYAVTPRFALSTSDAMLEVCQSLLRAHDRLLFQTHLNENPSEIDAVSLLFPWAPDYLSVYERHGLVGKGSVLAHNVHPTASELKRLASTGAAVAHCPCSNAALGSGIFPFRRHIEAGVRCALGTDVGGGTGFGILKEALQAYLLQRVHPTQPMTLTPAQMLYLATRAGAEALNVDHETGDFTPGKSADFVYVRPPVASPLAAVVERTDSLENILAALFTLGDASAISEVRVGGVVV
jgi:guanine deaminase